MFFKKKDDGTLKKIYGLTHIEGIPGFPENGLCQIFLYPDRIEINNNIAIKLERVKFVDVFSEQEVQTKGKSVIGRSIVGGILLGPLGAVIGGVSGTGDKKKNKIRFFLSIEFVGVDGADRAGVFLMPEFAPGVSDFVKKVNDIVRPEVAEGPREV